LTHGRLSSLRIWHDNCAQVIELGNVVNCCWTSRTLNRRCRAPSEIRLEGQQRTTQNKGVSHSVKLLGTVCHAARVRLPTTG